MVHFKTLRKERVLQHGPEEKAFAAQSDRMSLIPGAHKAEGENQLLTVVL